MMELRTRAEMPQRDLTPEHTKRGGKDHGAHDDGPLHPDISAAYDYVDSIVDTSDFKPQFAWHGWALREAFLAGISYAQKEK